MKRNIPCIYTPPTGNRSLSKSPKAPSNLAREGERERNLFDGRERIAQINRRALSSRSLFTRRGLAAFSSSLFFLSRFLLFFSLFTAETESLRSLHEEIAKLKSNLSQTREDLEVSVFIFSLTSQFAFLVFLAKILFREQIPYIALTARLHLFAGRQHEERPPNRRFERQTLSFNSPCGLQR